MEVTNKFEADKLSWQFFGRPLPMTHDEMKSAYRAACKRLHPDVAEVPMVYAEELFKQMNGFYQSIQNKPWAFSDAIAVAKTTTGELLTELGLGLGPLKNGRDCEGCQHKGYTEHIPEGWVRCTWCDYGWSYTHPCQVPRNGQWTEAEAARLSAMQGRRDFPLPLRGKM
jgi:hypothetical protein